jgi:hypothetical protein
MPAAHLTNVPIMSLSINGKATCWNGQSGMFCSCCHHSLAE